MARTRAVDGGNIWPGFVDALATLLLVITFLLSVFILAYFFISQALSGREEALVRLSEQINELAELLSLERQANSELRLNVTQLSASLQKTNEERETMVLVIDDLRTRAERAELVIAQSEELSEDAKEEARKRLLEIESLRRDITALRRVREKLELEVGNLAAVLRERDSALSRSAANLRQRETELSQRELELGALRDRSKELDARLGALRDRSKELEARLADERERTLLSQKEIEAREIRIEELLVLYEQSTNRLDEQRQLSAKAKSQVETLNRQIAALRAQLERLSAALDLAEAESTGQKAVIEDLGRKLNLALAKKVEELARYRSEFFGRLREVLGQRQDIRIVGDRFVFQSEVLFESGSAELEPAGQDQMAALARTLLDIAVQIPPEVNWLLRVDGHTDKIPIATARFPSNWELSSARALSVTHFLITQGIPPGRLAAAGFGEFQPLDPHDDEIANRRNRRIELKLDQR